MVAFSSKVYSVRRMRMIQHGIMGISLIGKKAGGSWEMSCLLIPKKGNLNNLAYHAAMVNNFNCKIGHLIIFSIRYPYFTLYLLPSWLRTSKVVNMIIDHTTPVIELLTSGSEPTTRLFFLSLGLYFTLLHLTLFIQDAPVVRH